MSKLEGAFEKVMKDVILNPSFNQDLFNQICSKIRSGDKISSGGENKGKEKFKSFEKGQDKRKEKSNFHSSTPPLAPKASKADKPVVSKVSDPDRSLCAAC